MLWYSRSQSKVYVLYSYNDRGTDRKSLFHSTQFFRTAIADSAIIVILSKQLNCRRLSPVTSKLQASDKDHGIAKTLQ